MKKTCLVMMVCALCSLLQAQVVAGSGSQIVNVEAQQSNEYFINGISTREDVGGVEVSNGQYRNGSGGSYQLKFTNYNSFAVSVIFEVNSSETGTIILQAGETKETGNAYYQPNSIKLIARQLGNVAAPVQQTSSLPYQVVLGTLAVYPKILSYGDARPDNEMITMLNNIKAYGLNKWRVPTYTELQILETEGVKIDDKRVYAKHAYYCYTQEQKSYYGYKEWTSGGLYNIVILVCTLE